jgi:hypothetical protein
MNGGDSNGWPFKDWAFEQWRAKYGTKPPWGKVDFIKLSTARERFDTEDLARAAWDAYLASTDEFYAGHDPGHFLSSLSRWVAKAPKAPVRHSDADEARYAEMRRILREVERDPSIPEDKKRVEAAKRWKAIEV